MAKANEVKPSEKPAQEPVIEPKAPVAPAQGRAKPKASKEPVVNNKPKSGPGGDYYLGETKI